MTPKEIQILVGQIRYKNWRIDVVHDFSSGERGHLYLQVAFKAVCHSSGKPSIQRGRKWLLSSHMTKTEIVRTAFLACLQAEIHEAHEAFTFLGRDVFNTHMDIFELHALSANGRYDLRPPLIADGEKRLRTPRLSRSANFAKHSQL